MDGAANYYGIHCSSGHKAALGIQFHMTNVWMESRPTPDEFKELVQKARERLQDDELWDGLLEQLYKNDRESRFCYNARKGGWYAIPCPSCGKENEILWRGMKFTEDRSAEAGWRGSYQCYFCKSDFSEGRWRENFEKAIFNDADEMWTKEKRRLRMMISPEDFLKPWGWLKHEWPKEPDQEPRAKSYGKYRMEVYQYKDAVEKWKDRHVLNDFLT